MAKVKAQVEITTGEFEPNRYTRKDGTVVTEQRGSCMAGTRAYNCTAPENLDMKPYLNKRLIWNVELNAWGKDVNMALISPKPEQMPLETKGK